MQISIDTNLDSPEDIIKAIELLKKFCDIVSTGTNDITNKDSTNSKEEIKNNHSESHSRSIFRTELKNPSLNPSKIDKINQSTYQIPTNPCSSNSNSYNSNSKNANPGDNNENSMGHQKVPKIHHHNLISNSPYQQDSKSSANHINQKDNHDSNGRIYDTPPDFSAHLELLKIKQKKELGLLDEKN
jgi:hypothetical protein